MSRSKENDATDARIRRALRDVHAADAPPPAFHALLEAPPPERRGPLVPLALGVAAAASIAFLVWLGVDHAADRSEDTAVATERAIKVPLPPALFETTSRLLSARLDVAPPLSSMRLEPVATSGNDTASLLSLRSLPANPLFFGSSERSE